MANPVVHFEIMAGRNVEAVRRFYADVFEWTIDADNPMKYGVVTPVAPGIGGGIAEASNGQSSVTVYVHADDLPATLARIEAHGGTTTMPPMDIPFAKISIATFKDPAGNQIGLVKPWM